MPTKKMTPDDMMRDMENMMRQGMSKRQAMHETMQRQANQTPMQGDMSGRKMRKGK